MRLFLLPFLCIVLPALSMGSTLYVPDEYTTIQEAILAAYKGDLIIVKPGIYYENITFLGKAIVVKSEKGPYVTAIDGRQIKSTVTFDENELWTSVLCGFTLTNGIGTLTESEDISDTYGGGIRCDSASPILVNNIITGNVSTYGGGIYCKNSLPLIVNNLIYKNKAAYGGGVCSQVKSFPRITNCTLAKNESFYGGGVCVKKSSYTTVTNSILWNNQAQKGKEVYIGDETPFHSCLTIRYSDLEGGQSSVFMETGCALNWYDGMIDADPLFFDLKHNDYHIVFKSPCRDTGNSKAQGLQETDLEGDPRIAHGGVDMGSDELYPHLYYTGDPTPGGWISVNVLGTPIMYTLLFASEGQLFPHIPTHFGDWHLMFPVRIYFLGFTPWKGFIAYRFQIPYLFPAPVEIYMQALVRHQLTNLCHLYIK